MAKRMQQRRGTAAQWISVNSGDGPTLNVGEIGFETDTGKFKIGDGVNAWVDLEYFLDEAGVTSITGDYVLSSTLAQANGVATLDGTGVLTSSQIPTTLATESYVDTAVSNLVDSAPGALDTLNELAAALNDDASFSTTITNSLALKAPLESPSFTGTTKVQQILEKATVSATAATGTVNYDLLTNGAVTYYTSNASGNWTLNIRGDGSNTIDSIMSTGQSLTIAFLVTNGGTAYYQTALQVDGNAITPKWQNGTAPSSGNTSSIDIYSVTLIKTGSATFTALASQTKFA